MAYRALSDVLLGNQPPVSAGDLVPETYPDQDGSPQPVDFERLVEIGAAEKVQERGRAKAKP